MYDDMFSRAIRYEYRKSLEIVSVRPSGVDTLLPAQLGFKKRGGLLQISPQAFVRAVLRNLHKSTSPGHYWHELQSWSLGLIPECLAPSLLPVMMAIAKKL
jgi:hypothetical protein